MNARWTARAIGRASRGLAFWTCRAGTGGYRGMDLVTAAGRWLATRTGSGTLMNAAAATGQSKLPAGPRPVQPRAFGRVFGPATRVLLASAALVLGGCAHHGLALGSVNMPKPFKHHHNHAYVQELPASNITTIGVNSYLWRASLDVLSFMPLLQTDSNGGVIVTDWYTNPGNPGERMKVTVTILDRDLRADALRVAASRQVAQNGVWVEAPVQAATVQKLEDIILTKARDIRNGGVPH